MPSKYKPCGVFISPSNASYSLAPFHDNDKLAGESSNKKLK